MAKVLISILSDQLIPNYLFIKESVGEYDKLLFITTSQMEAKKVGENLEITLGLDPMSVERIETSDFNYSSILIKLNNYKFNKEDEYCINQTGGTKVLSIALYEFFQNYSTRFVYLPIGKNICYDFNRANSFPIKYRMNLNEYLSLYGLEYECENNMVYDINVANGLFEEITRNNYDAFSIYEISNAHYLPSAIDKKYYAGGWFEDYTFDRIRDEYGLPYDHIGKSVKVYKRGHKDNYNDNEVDVMFVKDNILYVIECKASISSLHTSISINSYLYKLAAVCKNMGLRVNSYLFTTMNLSYLQDLIQKNIEKRRKILNITGIIDGRLLSEQYINL